VPPDVRQVSDLPREPDNAPEPEMPPFDPSKFEPMPEVEINPKDEFYVEVGEA